jgi:hypothetical protein
LFVVQIEERKVKKFSPFVWWNGEVWRKKYEQIDMLIDVMLILSLIKWEMSIESTLDVW